MTVQRARASGLATLATGVVAGALLGFGWQVHAGCNSAEYWHLTAPVVTLVSGPGDPAAEQEQWDELAPDFWGLDAGSEPVVSTGSVLLFLESQP